MRWRSRLGPEEHRLSVRNLFLFVGADPATGWLDGCGVKLDRAGFVLTGVAGRQNGDRPVPPLETTVPGVFAVGDVRSGSVKRVGGAIGEGAQVVAALHGFLGDAGKAGALGSQHRYDAVRDPRGVTSMTAKGCTPYRRHPDRHAERARLRGMPEERQPMAAFADLPQLAAMSAAATIPRTSTRPRISTPPAIPSSKATIRRKAGAGAMSTRCCSICRTARRRITVRSRAIIDSRRRAVLRRL